MEGTSSETGEKMTTIKEKAVECRGKALTLKILQETAGKEEIEGR
jgi:hypothetical protein